MDFADLVGATAQLVDGVRGGSVLEDALRPDGSLRHRLGEAIPLGRGEGEAAGERLSLDRALHRPLGDAGKGNGIGVLDVGVLDREGTHAPAFPTRTTGGGVLGSVA